jgi:uncharacterized membrane protein
VLEDDNIQKNGWKSGKGRFLITNWPHQMMGNLYGKLYISLSVCKIIVALIYLPMFFSTIARPRPLLDSPPVAGT